MSRGVGRDHETVRGAIAAAACVLVAEEGAGALTVRRVAAAAGVSPGRVQHYFPDRTTLMLAAFDSVQHAVAAEVATAVGEAAAPEQVLTAVLRAMIPTDDAAMRRLRVVAQFESLALTEDILATRIREGHAELLAFLERLLESSRIRLDSNNTEGTLQGLLATAEGLSGQVLLGQSSPDRALALLQTSIDDMFRGVAS